MGNLSDDLAAFEAARARCQAKYDAMEPVEGPEVMECIECGELEMPLHIGKIGCTAQCASGTNEDDAFCRKHHQCQCCRRRVNEERGTGRY